MGFTRAHGNETMTVHGRVGTYMATRRWGSTGVMGNTDAALRHLDCCAVGRLRTERHAPCIAVSTDTVGPSRHAWDGESRHLNWQTASHLEILASEAGVA